jgi:hypothetical protein
MFTSEFAIRFMVEIRSAVSAKALLKFWIAVSVSAFMCSPPSRSCIGRHREQDSRTLRTVAGAAGWPLPLQEGPLRETGRPYPQALVVSLDKPAPAWSYPP